jgi:hypothetical protein
MFPSKIQSSNSSQTGADEKPDSQSPLIMTSYRLKPYHKDGLQNELNFGHWSRHYDMQRESG